MQARRGVICMDVIRVPGCRNNVVKYLEGYMVLWKVVPSCDVMSLDMKHDSEQTVGDQVSAIGPDKDVRLFAREISRELKNSFPSVDSSSPLLSYAQP